MTWDASSKTEIAVNEQCLRSVLFTSSAAPLYTVSCCQSSAQISISRFPFCLKWKPRDGEEAPNMNFSPQRDPGFEFRFGICSPYLVCHFGWSDTLDRGNEEPLNSGSMRKGVWQDRQLEWAGLPFAACPQQSLNCYQIVICMYLTGLLQGKELWEETMDLVLILELFKGRTG